MKVQKSILQSFNGTKELAENSKTNLEDAYFLTGQKVLDTGEGHNMAKINV